MSATSTSVVSGIDTGVGVNAYGTQSPTGNGILTSFSWPHGMPNTPNCVIVMPRNGVTAALSYVSCDAVNINVFYLVAPIGNMSFYWMAI